MTAIELVLQINKETDLKICRDPEEGYYWWVFHTLDSEKTFTYPNEAVFDFIYWATKSMNKDIIEAAIDNRIEEDATALFRQLMTEDLKP